MPKSKKELQAEIEELKKQVAEGEEAPAEVAGETPVAAEPTPEVAVEESVAKTNFRNMMAAYKVQNPVKYAQKEAEFEKRLKEL